MKKRRTFMQEFKNKEILIMKLKKSENDYEELMLVFAFLWKEIRKKVN